MKKILFFIAFVIFVSCKSETKKEEQQSVDMSTVKFSGQEIFEGKGNCIACHKPNQKVIGPSLEDIGKIYKDKKGSIVAFLKEESDPLVDPSQYDIMKTNFAITKSMSDEELKALEDYIYSFSK